MHKLIKSAFVILAGSVWLPAVIASEKTFVTVNGNPIPQVVADVYITQAKSHGMPAGPELQNHVRDELIKRELLWQEAKKAGLDKKGDVAAKAEQERQKAAVQAEAVKQTIIIRAYIEEYLKKHPVSDAELQSVYQKMRAKGGNTDYKVRHILVGTETEANAVLSRLGKGAKFEEVAKESIDSASKQNGGDLGWSVPSKFAKPFADAMVSLKPGKYTAAPVKTEHGYHIIKVDETRPLVVPSFDEMKPLLKRQAEEHTIQKLVEGLRSKAKVH